jgi:hypothetical protein
VDLGRNRVEVRIERVDLGRGKERVEVGRDSGCKERYSKLTWRVCVRESERESVREKVCTRESVREKVCRRESVRESDEERK